VARQLDFLTTDFCYVRLLGDRTKIEALTTTWDREVIDRSASLERWAELLRQLTAQNTLTWIFINNHYAGHAPATVRALEALYRAGLGGGSGGAPGSAPAGDPGRAPGSAPEGDSGRAPRSAAAGDPGRAPRSAPAGEPSGAPGDAPGGSPPTSSAP
jgi:hypothetical protein